MIQDHLVEFAVVTSRFSDVLPVKLYCMFTYDVLTATDSPEMGSWKLGGKKRGAELALKM